jgi:hypothetical protein
MSKSTPNQESRMNTATYRIDNRVDSNEVEKVLKRYAKRLVGLGHAEPTWTFEVEGQRIVVTITGVPEVASLVVAVVDQLSDDQGAKHNILRTFPGQDGWNLAAFRDADLRCDHCGTNRRRHQCFIVQDAATAGSEHAKLLMVGSTCVDEYSDREGTLRMWQALADLNAAFVAFEDYDGSGDDDGLGGGGGGSWPLSVRGFTAAASCAIRHFGWHKSAEGDDATKLAALEIYTGSKYHEVPVCEQRDYDEADAAIAWAWDQLEAAQQGDNDYLYNLATIAHQAQISRRFMGILASLPFAYQRTLAREAQRAAEQAAKNCEPLAADGTKVKDVAVTIIDTRWIEGAYGTSLMIKMQDDSGRVLVWFASNPPSIEAGEKALVSGTIKRFNADRCETNLTRCKLVVKAVA